MRIALAAAVAAVPQEGSHQGRGDLAVGGPAETVVAKHLKHYSQKGA